MTNEMRQLPRQGLADTKIFEMSVVSFKRLDRCDLIAKVVDMSPRGVGIESALKVDPGFVWFSEKIDGYRAGLLMWSKQRDSMCRGGIKFVSLTAEDEQAIEKEFEEQGRLKNAMIIADRMIESLKNSGEPGIVQTH